MKLGVIARADDRGLGNQTWEVCRHLHPDRVLVIRAPGSERQGFPVHLDRFPGATVVTVDERHWTLPEQPVRDWLDGLDVIYTAETLYDPRIADWARDQHVATVIHANPEWYREGAQNPTAWWSATRWRAEHLPADTRLVPMPVPTDRWPTPRPGDTVLHVGGKAAANDRNGSHLARAHVDSHSDQDRRPIANYWEIYEGHGILVLPRRYGGLCLPVIEACGAGLVPIMPDVDPNGMWPIVPVPATRTGSFTMMGGTIDLHDVDPTALDAAIQHTRDHLNELRQDVTAWVDRNSWDALTARWLDELSRAADGRPTPPPTPTVAIIVPFTPGRCEQRDRIWEHLKTRWQAAYPRWPIIEGTPTSEHWSKGEALADALTRTDADILVVADADSWIDTDLRPAVAGASVAGWAVPHKTVHRLDDTATNQVLDGGPFKGEVERRVYDGWTGGGIVIITRDLAQRIPLDPRFHGWGGEDQSWGRALRTLHGQPWRANEPLWHLHHPPQPRPDRNQPNQTERLRRRYYRAQNKPKEMAAIIEEAHDALASLR